MTCAISVEDTWGPVVSTSCLQGFDFTLLFEESVLTILPLGLIGTVHRQVLRWQFMLTRTTALWSCVRGYRLLRSPAKVLVSWLLIAKLVICTSSPSHNPQYLIHPRRPLTWLTLPSSARCSACGLLMKHPKHALRWPL